MKPFNRYYRLDNLYLSLYNILHKIYPEVIMSTITKQANFLIPEDILDDLKRSVSKRQQSKVVAEALRKELKRLKLEKTIQTSFGAWKDKDHPELKSGVSPYVRNMRKSSRLKRTA